MITACHDSPLAQSQRGLTLIELLAVISILALVACLLFPALSKARKSAQRTVCLSNLKQINFAIQLYSNDANDTAPTPEGITANRMLTLVGYKALVRDYVGGNSGKSRIFACPADSFFFGLSNGFTVVRLEPLHEQSAMDYASYGFNGVNLDTNLVNRAWKKLGLDFSRFGVAGRKITSIKNPSRTLLAAEMSAFKPFSWHAPKLPLIEHSQYCDSMNTVTFVDGHAGYIKIFWTNSIFKGVQFEASLLDPPPGYEYQWSVD